MLDSVKIQRRQSEVRQALAELAGAESLTDEQRSKMDALDREYGDNERRFRAALIAEDQERREAGKDLETREAGERDSLVGRYEVRQAALALAEDGRALTGATAEVVAEMREKGSYRGIPVPLGALETRAGETVAGGTPDPMRTMPIVDRLFAESVAMQMGGQVIDIPFGQVEWPVVTSSVAAGWAATETGNVAGPTVFATTDKALAPNQNLGIQMKVTRRAMLQSGPALEQAVRRDMQTAIRVKLDHAAFLGSGSSGEPTGIITGAENSPADYDITVTAIDGAARWSSFRGAIVRFMANNAASSPSQVRVLVRPEIWSALDGYIGLDGTSSTFPLTELDRMLKQIGPANLHMTANALAAPTGSPETSKAVLTTRAGGVAPFFVGLWGGVDLIRDPYSDAASGGLRITGLLTADVTVARPAQIEVLTGLEDS